MSAERQSPSAAYVPTQMKERSVIRSEERTSADLRSRSSGVSDGRANRGGLPDGHTRPLPKAHAQDSGTTVKGASACEVVRGRRMFEYITCHGWRLYEEL